MGGSSLFSHWCTTNTWLRMLAWHNDIYLHNGKVDNVKKGWTGKSRWICRWTVWALWKRWDQLGLNDWEILLTFVNAGMIVEDCSWLLLVLLRGVLLEQAVSGKEFCQVGLNFLTLLTCVRSQAFHCNDASMMAFGGNLAVGCSGFTQGDWAVLHAGLGPMSFGVA